jgi:hypothetical protein
MTADAEFSGETPAPRPAGERVDEIAARHARDEAADEWIKREVWSAALDSAHADRGYLLAALTATHESARREGERALEEERGLRVQLSDDSQRHLDRALAAEQALAQARAALRKWGQHATYCTWHININTCNCEFGALLTTGGGSE